MRKLIAGALSATLLSASLVASAVPAQAANHSRTYYVNNFCASHPRAPDCMDWRHNGHHWDNHHYRTFYRNHQSAFPGLVAGIFGLAVGAAIANSANNNGGYNNGGYNSHVARCEDHYRSYDPRTDTFMGYDGYHHRCML